MSKRNPEQTKGNNFKLPYQFLIYDSCPPSVLYQGVKKYTDKPMITYKLNIENLFELNLFGHGFTVQGGCTDQTKSWPSG